MRLKKGTKVEVLTKKEVPSGSWHCGEIVGGNDHTYAVRYLDDLGSSGKEMVESVVQKEVRPCPPSVDELEDWVPGDLVEVFHNFSWKMARVLKVSGQNHVFVRLLGSANQLKANKYGVRARRCWQDGKWTVIQQASGRHEDARLKLPSSRTDNNQSQKMGANLSQGGDAHDRDTNGVLASNAIPSRIPKRKLYYLSPKIKIHTKPNQKVNVGKKDSNWCHLGILPPHQLPEKVNKVTCSQEVLPERSMHPLMKNVTLSRDLIYEREETISLKTEDNSITSSVGSCSVYENSHILQLGFTSGPIQDNDSQYSDAESVCNLAAKEDLIEEIHRLELHAYRRILEALHASGPLSWEQEFLLTDLRDSLHISNDEHLKEIRNLII